MYACLPGSIAVRHERARNETQLARVVQALQDRVNRRQIVLVLREVEADRLQPLPDVGG
jgi:hypothetical protein